MDEVIRWYLVMWDRHAGHTEVEEYDDQQKAFGEYIARERDLSHMTAGPDPRLEVVLIGAESIDELRVGYPHYFSQGSRSDRVDELLHKLAI